MVSRIIAAVIVGIFVTLGCILLGALLIALHIELATTVGTFLWHYSGLIGVLAALWHFFAGGGWPIPR